MFPEEQGRRQRGTRAELGLRRPQIFSLLTLSSANALQAIHASTCAIHLADTNSLAFYCDREGFTKMSFGKFFGRKGRFYMGKINLF